MCVYITWHGSSVLEVFILCPIHDIARELPHIYHFSTYTSDVNMKEVVFPQQGAEPVLSETEKPSPGADQILVKSLWMAINPV